MPKYDRDLIARMLETPAVFEDASRREQARLLREADNLEADARTVVREVQDGMVLVPARMELTPENMAALAFMLGGDPDAKDADERWSGGTLWVGETIGDNGEKYYGLNVANVECYEEGSIPIVEFAAAQAASGVHPDALPDGTLSKSTAKRVEALASASVSERARLLLADTCDRAGLYETADGLRANLKDLDLFGRAALRAIEQALTQQRGDDVESAARALFEAQADPLAASWDRQWGPTKELWRKVARGNLYATTPQPSADAVRELVKRWRGSGKAIAHICADELESLLSAASDHQQNAAQGGGEK